MVSWYTVSPTAESGALHFFFFNEYTESETYNIPKKKKKMRILHRDELGYDIYF